MHLLENMKSKIASLFRFDTFIVILIFVAFSLLWIDWGKLNVTGWNLPGLYKKMTKTTNTILFFSKKESPYLAYIFYIVPVLGALSVYYAFNLKNKTAKIFFALSCVLGIATTIYMYFYFIDSSIFGLSNAGIGIHLLGIVSLVGFFYSFKTKKKSLQTITTFDDGNTTDHRG